MKQRATLGRTVLAACILAAGIGAAPAQDFPTRSIRVIVGPGPDIIPRLFGPKMATHPELVLRPNCHVSSVAERRGGERCLPPPPPHVQVRATERTFRQSFLQRTTRAEGTSVQIGRSSAERPVQRGSANRSRLKPVEMRPFR